MPAVTADSTSVCIRLTPSQLAQVRAADRLGDLIADVTAGLEAGLGADWQSLTQLIAAASSDAKISASLLRGLYLFAALPKDGSSVGIVEFARRTGMSPSTTHRYLNTLVAAGLLERDSDTRGYRRAQIGRQA